MTDTLAIPPIETAVSPLSADSLRLVPSPGVYHDIPAETYFAWDACNASSLKTLARSPSHFYWARNNPDEPTPAKLLGSACHTAILEPDLLESRYIIAEQCCGVTQKGGDCENNGKILSAGHWWCGVHGKRLVADPRPGVIGEDGELIPSPILTAGQMGVAKASAISVRRNFAARDLLAVGKKEVCIVWVNSETGVLCKARLDCLNDGERKIPDIKTCEDASPDGFLKQIAKFGYHIQSAFYVDAATAISGDFYDSFYFIAVEKEPPFVTAVYKAHQEMLQLGRSRYLQLLADYKWCKERNYWPGYHDGQIMPIGLPHWFFNQEQSK